MPVTEKTFQRVVLEDPETRWELHRGRLVEKPAMTFPHNDVSFELAHQIRNQIDPKRYRVRANGGHVNYGDRTYFIPDVAVIPVSALSADRNRPGVIEVYGTPLPFIAEVWSTSTGDYDVDTKFPEYRARGDLEIWRVQPYDRVITVWQRQVDGSYVEYLHHGGRIDLIRLPGVVVDLDALYF